MNSPNFVLAKSIFFAGIARIFFYYTLLKDKAGVVFFFLRERGFALSLELMEKVSHRTATQYMGA